MSKTKEPYVEEPDRPHLGTDPNTPISALRVRDLVAILGGRSVKPHPKFEGQSPLKEFFDKPFPEVNFPLDPSPLKAPAVHPELMETITTLGATLSRLENQVAALSERMKS